ncbi:MAG: hypothetical protein ING25_06795 [Burkholderiales bacterium]|nr:hypothetical protein [Burkholderiales bacterium]
MVLEIHSTAAFSPPPPIALYEPADRLGARLTQARPRSLPALTNVTTTTTSIGEWASQFVQKRSDFSQVALELSKRIQSLKVEAELDGVTFSVASYADFVSFLVETRPRSRPSLFLHDNGNLRALWRNNAREQVGLQFLGGGNIQFVIFKRRSGAEAMTRVAGVDTKPNILGHIRACGALGLLAT